jgi:hypothetical protein
MKEREMFINLIVDDITVGLTELRPRGLPKYDPVVRYFLKKVHSSSESFNIYKI